MAVSDKPQRQDLDKCVHCGLCLNSCPTYRELGVEMDSPRGRIYQMNQVSQGLAQIGPSYIEHLELCLACRGCETACPSGVQYGKLIEAARAEIETQIKRPWYVELVRTIVFRHLLPSRTNLRMAASSFALGSLDSAARHSCRIFSFSSDFRRTTSSSNVPGEISRAFSTSEPFISVSA